MKILDKHDKLLVSYEKNSDPIDQKNLGTYLLVFHPALYFGFSANHVKSKSKSK